MELHVCCGVTVTNINNKFWEQQERKRKEKMQIRNGNGGRNLRPIAIGLQFLRVVYKQLIGITPLVGL
jgi:hypothetical protein